MTKKELRKQLFDARRSLSPTARDTANAGLRPHLIDFLHRQSAHHIAAYMPVETEPGGLDLVPYLHSQGFDVIVPVAHPDFSMSWVRYFPDLPFTQGAFGISEPAGPALSGTPLADVDVIVVPALAADRHGFRLGKGGGYYDRALAKLSDPVTVSLIFTHELLGTVPRESHDSPISAIITPEEIFVPHGTF